MQVKLIKTGGLLGKKMSASQEWKYSDEDWKELVQTIEKKETTAKRIPDAFHYALQKGNGEEIKIDISSIPSKYQSFFERLFENLKSEKR
jgi:oligoribonuclease NrnB/cAMP/cGMP phosphodiesterase (DHH superfamily)